tara:strand:- start:8739 stop:10457 length:1719 start_codon:yes stop_codon:yes gene_type:complete
MQTNYKLIPIDKQYKGAPLVDTTLNINLEDTSKHLIEGDITVPLNLTERFNDERQNFSLYRIYGKLQPYIENAYSGTADQTVSNLIYNMYLTTSYLSANTTTTSVSFKGYPDFSEFDFVRNDVDESVNDETNWNLYITVPTTCNELQEMVFTSKEGGPSMSFSAYEGIPYSIKNKKVGGKNLLEFTCPVPHGLEKGNNVILDIKEPNYTFSNGVTTYPVYSLGNNKRKSEKNVFNLYIPQVDVGNNPINDDTLGVFKRQLIKGDNTSISNYYVLVHEIITNVEDYQITQCGFAEGIFKRTEKFQSKEESPNVEDKIVVKQAYPTYVYTFTKDINVKKYLDNLKRPITTLYVTTLLRNNLGYFDYPPKYGWGWNFPYSFVDTNSNGQIVKGNPNDLQPVTGLIYSYPGGVPGPLKSGIPLVPGDKLRGAFTEYNVHELKERTISEIKHNFNFNGQVFNGAQGYTYKPHYPVPIRVYSDYIESGDPNKIANVPNYSTYFEIEKTWKWRDIYEIGFVQGNNGVDYPFLNAAHYPRRDINFFTSRTNRSTAFSNNDSTSFSGANNTLENFAIDGCE